MIQQKITLHNYKRLKMEVRLYNPGEGAIALLGGVMKDGAGRITQIPLGNVTSETRTCYYL